MNGGGKTTLMDAIRLSLYGHRAPCSTRGNLSYPEFLKQCINRRSQEAAIELVFQQTLNNEAQPTEFRIYRVVNLIPTLSPPGKPMECPLCGHHTAHKHGRTAKGHQRFKCPACDQTFTETFDTLSYRRQLAPEEVHTIWQAHSEGSSLRGIARRSFNTVSTLVQQAALKGQRCFRCKDFG